MTYCPLVTLKLARSITGAFGGMNSGKSFSTRSRRFSGNLPSLNCFYTNATSLINKWSDFNSLILVLESPHIILITETWFNTLSICKLDNYNLFCKNREAVRGGGFAIYVRSDLESFEFSDGTLSNTRSEQVWCFVKVNKETILVGCVYRPPLADGGISHEISKSIDYVSHLCKADS